MKQDNKTASKQAHELAGKLIDFIFENSGATIAIGQLSEKVKSKLVPQVAHELWNFKPSPTPNPVIPVGTPSVATLRRAGLKVRVTEKRYVADELGLLFAPIGEVKKANREFESKNPGLDRPLKIISHGGYQKIDITFPDGTETSGEAITLPNDIFHRSYGRNLAVSRALKGIDISKYLNKAVA